MFGILTLSLKITNWCDLNCAHCCECSGRNNPTNFMPPTKAEDYIGEFQEIPFNLSKYYTIGGGEGLAPYQFDDYDYIPQVLSCIYKVDGVPTVKTNGVWGEKCNLRSGILKSLANSAYIGNKLLTLDISVDEFHNNLNGVANIITDVVQSDYLLPAIRISLLGFKTPGTQNTMAQLRSKLEDRNVSWDNISNGDIGVYRSGGSVGMRMIVLDDNEIFNLGRAKQNNISTTTNQPTTSYVNCIQVDNNNLAVLNNLYFEQIAGRPLPRVFESLQSKVK